MMRPMYLQLSTMPSPDCCALLLLASPLGQQLYDEEAQGIFQQQYEVPLHCTPVLCTHKESSNQVPDSPEVNVHSKGLDCCFFLLLARPLRQ